MKNKWIRSSLCFILASIMTFGMVGCGEKEDEVDDKPTVRTDFSDYVPETDTSGNLSEVFQSAESIDVTTEELVSVSAPTAQINGAQGGCVVGDYFYQAFYRNDGGSEGVCNECIIMKVDINTGEVVKQSEVYQLNHINDIEYNSKLDCLVVVHGIPLRNIISYVDTETLEVIDTFTISEYIWSIAYNAQKNQYVVGLSGGQNFKILDADFNPVSELIEPEGITCTTQAASCDDDYIYFIMYNPNCIMVYDWDGNFVTMLDIKLPVKIWETESVMAINGEIYIGCAELGKDSASLFKITELVPKVVTE